MQGPGSFVFVLMLAGMRLMFTVIDAVQAYAGLPVAAMVAGFVLRTSTLLHAGLLLLLLPSFLLPLSYSYTAIVIVAELLRLFCRL
jgi:hypothetical protein